MIKPLQVYTYVCVCVFHIKVVHHPNSSVHFIFYKISNHHLQNDKTSHNPLISMLRSPRPLFSVFLIYMQFHSHRSSTSFIHLPSIYQVACPINCHFIPLACSAMCLSLNLFLLTPSGIFRY